MEQKKESTFSMSGSSLLSLAPSPRRRKLHLLFASPYGQTKRIADFLAHQALNKDNWNVAVTEITKDNKDMVIPSDTDAVIVGCPVYFNHHDANVISVVKKNNAFLSTIPSAFFQVCGNSSVKEDSNAAVAWSESFLKQTAWTPMVVRRFAGATWYTKYPFPTRLMMRAICWWMGTSTDTSKDHDYTNWNGVELFGDVFASAAQAFWIANEKKQARVQVNAKEKEEKY